jgi:hypothetical protein
MGENTLMIRSYGARGGRIHTTIAWAKLPDDREEEIVELNSKEPVPGEGKKDKSNLNV